MRSVLAAPAVSLLLLSSSCAYEDAEVESNGTQGALHLTRARSFAGLCGPAPAADACARRWPCWTTHLEPGPHELVVSRRVRLQSGNGLGDTSRCITHEALGQTQPKIVVSPTSAATVSGVTVCSDALRLTLNVHQIGDFELQVTQGELNDRFRLSGVSGCVAYTCNHAPTRPGPGSCR